MSRKTVYTLDQQRTFWVVTNIEGQCACGSGGNESQTFTYNNFGELLTQTNALGETSSFTYDGVGNRLTVPNPLRATAFTYDVIGQVKTVTDVFLQTISYLYDENGNRQSASYGGSSLSYQYDFINRVKQITHNSVGTTTYDYDLVNPSDTQARMHRRTLPNGVVVTAELDRLDRVKKLTHVKGTTWSGDIDYSYDAVDQITTISEQAHPG